MDRFPQFRISELAYSEKVPGFSVTFLAIRTEPSRPQRACPLPPRDPGAEGRTAEATGAHSIAEDEGVRHERRGSGLAPVGQESAVVVGIPHLVQATGAPPALVAGVGKENEQEPVMHFCL